MFLHKIIDILFRFNYPKFPSVRTIIAQPANCNNEYEEGQVKLAKVKKVLMDKDAMEKIKEEYYLSDDASQEEYTKMREERIRAMLKVAKLGFDEYHKLLAMNKKGVQIILQRDIEEVNINSYNPKWLELWNANLDIQPVADFFAVVTYITEYAFKPEPQELEIIKALEAVKGQSMEKSPEQLCTLVVAHVKEQSEMYVGGKIKDAIVTVPGELQLPINAIVPGSKRVKYLYW